MMNTKSRRCANRFRIYWIVMPVLLILSRCSIQKKLIYRAPYPAFDIEGHRGARGLMPENTVQGMYKAIDLGVNTIEMDCLITKDSMVILSHNNALNPLHTLKPDGSELDQTKDYIFFQMPYNELKQFDVGSKFYKNFPRQKKFKDHIPLLGNLIDSVQNYLSFKSIRQVFYNIETKTSMGIDGDGKYHPDPKIFVDLLMEVIIRKKITPWVIIQSADVRTLKALHEKYPYVRTSLLAPKGTTVEGNIEKLGFVPDIYSPNYTRTTPEIIKACKDRNMKVVVWTINTKEEIEKFRKMGVDGIISDYPNLFFE